MPRHNKTYKYNNISFSSIKALSNYTGINEKTIAALYNSVSEATRKLNLEHKENTIRSRLKAGWSADDAFTF